MVFILGMKVIRDFFERSFLCEQAGSEKAVSDEFPPGAPRAFTVFADEGIAPEQPR